MLVYIKAHASMITIPAVYILTSPSTLATSSRIEMARFAGTWKLEKSENFEDFMKAVGVGMVMRKMGSTAKPNQDITIEGDKWGLKTSSSLKTTDIHFTLGEPFDETTADGRKVKTVMSLEGDNKLVQTQEHEKYPSVLTRELVDDNYMLMSCVSGDTIAKRHYKRA